MAEHTRQEHTQTAYTAMLPAAPVRNERKDGLRKATSALAEAEARDRAGKSPEEVLRSTSDCLAAKSRDRIQEEFHMA